MKKSLMALPLIAALALSGCMTTGQQNQLGGAVVGGAAGLAGAKILGANDNWTMLATLAGAAAGTMIAKNATTGECAYSNGDGTYRTGPCP